MIATIPRRRLRKDRGILVPTGPGPQCRKRTVGLAPYVEAGRFRAPAVVVGSPGLAADQFSVELDQVGSLRRPHVVVQELAADRHILVDGQGRLDEVLEYVPFDRDALTLVRPEHIDRGAVAFEKIAPDRQILDIVVVAAEDPGRPARARMADEMVALDHGITRVHTGAESATLERIARNHAVSGILQQQVALAAVGIPAHVHVVAANLEIRGVVDVDVVSRAALVGIEVVVEDPEAVRVPEPQAIARHVRERGVRDGHVVAVPGLDATPAVRPVVTGMIEREVIHYPVSGIGDVDADVARVLYLDVLDDDVILVGCIDTVFAALDDRISAIAVGAERDGGATRARVLDRQLPLQDAVACKQNRVAGLEGEAVYLAQ